jgi:hypothetical protein
MSTAGQDDHAPKLYGVNWRQTTTQSVPTKQWWASRRVRYNIGLVVAGLLAFACYTAVVLWGISVGAIPDPGAITL